MIWLVACPIQSTCYRGKEKRGKEVRTTDLATIRSCGWCDKACVHRRCPTQPLKYPVEKNLTYANAAPAGASRSTLGGWLLDEKARASNADGLSLQGGGHGNGSHQNGQDHQCTNRLHCEMFTQSRCARLKNVKQVCKCVLREKRARQKREP